MQLKPLATVVRAVTHGLDDAADAVVGGGADGRIASRAGTAVGPAVPAEPADLLAAMRAESARLQQANGGMSFAERAAAELAPQAGRAAVVPETYTRNVGKVAQELGVTKTEVNAAIHAVKDDAKIGGARRNGDVWIDTADGEVYAVKGDHSPSPESMGNLLGFLGRTRG